MTTYPRRISRWSVLVLVVGLLAWLAMPAFARQVEKPDQGVKLDGYHFGYGPTLSGWDHLDESLRWFGFDAYDGEWSLARGLKVTADVIQFSGQWATCQPYSNGEVPDADALIRVYRWEASEALDGTEGVVFDEAGFGGTLDISVEIPGTYEEIPAKAIGPAEDPSRTCEGIGDAIETPLVSRRLELALTWESELSPGKGKRIQADTTVTDLTVATFGGQPMSLPFGDQTDAYSARSAPFTGFVNHTFNP